MDILIHTFSGVAAGTVASSFSDKGFRTKLGIILFGCFGGALPDFDAISMYSKFDPTIGSFLNLSHTGKEIYFSKFWYSHHAALHSIVGCLLVATIIALFIYLSKSKLRNLSLRGYLQGTYAKRFFFLAFISGFLIHLLEDMPTPSCVWGGVNLFFPSSGYIGGTGDIWWWNNYDIFLIVISIILLNSLILSLKRVIKVPLWKITTSVFLAASILVVFQIKTRGFDFNYTGFTVKHAEYEAKSKEIQKNILGEKLYGYMMKLDNIIPLNF